jgi:glyoxylase-like metal-dependent hydrolase (beta-lactamase superfamily II)
MSLRPPSRFVVAPGVDGFRSVMVNYFFIRAQRGEWVLVDAALPGSGRRLVTEAARRFDGRPPRAIVLTQGHFDHVGALAGLLRRWPDAPVYVHPNELPFVAEGRPYPPADPTVGGGMLALTSWMYPRRMGPYAPNVFPLPADGSVPALPGWRWFSTPGHSPGHISLWRKRDRLLIAGDAVTTTRQESLWAVLRQEREVRPPPAYFTPDWIRAFESLVRIAELRADTVATGHGVPAGGLYFRDNLAQLIRTFSRTGLPRRGRYLPSSPGGIPAPALPPLAWA